MVDEIVNKLKLKKNIMKMKLNKWIGIMTGILVLLVSLNSCVKNRNELGTDFSHLEDHVLLVNGGLQNFGASNVRFDTDTATSDITANLASVNLPTSPVKVTIAIDAAKIAAYNSANGTSFQAFPAGSYKLLTTLLTIPAGQQTATTKVEFYKEALDPTISYLLPISITDASGKALSSNQNTIFYNVIGNVIAGNYKWDFTRYNDAAGTILSGLSFTNHAAVFIADSPTQVEVLSGYFIQPRYVISFTNNNGILSNFKVTLNPADVDALTAAGVTVTSGPTIIKADPVTGEYIFNYVTKTRNITDRFYK